MHSMEQIKANVNSIDRQLLLMIYEQQVETNSLLRKLTNENNAVEQIHSDDDKNVVQDDLDSLKRPQLMQRMAKLPNKPPGFHKWDTEHMRKHLKGAS